MIKQLVAAVPDDANGIIWNGSNGLYQSHRLLKKLKNHFNTSKSLEIIGLPPASRSMYTGYLYYLTHESVGICVPEACREEVERLEMSMPVYYGYNTDPVHIVSPEEEDQVIDCMNLEGKLVM